MAQDEVDRRFDDARARFNEGLLLKQPESPYTPGRRGLNWLKLKRPLDTLDVVVVGAEWGHGKRRGVLSDVTFAVRVDDTEQLATIGKAYTGLTDVEIAEMTALLLEITVATTVTTARCNRSIVLEVAFDAVQVSARHAPVSRCVSRASRAGGTTSRRRRSTRCPASARLRRQSSASACNSSTRRAREQFLSESDRSRPVPGARLRTCRSMRNSCARLRPSRSVGATSSVTTSTTRTPRSIPPFRTRRCAIAPATASGAR